MELVLVSVSTMLAVEVFLHIGLTGNIRAMIHFSRRAAATLTSARISDHWKEKVLLHYAVKIFVNSLQLIFRLLCTAAPLVLACVLAEGLGFDLLSELMAPAGLLLSIIVASLYALFRIKVFRVGL
jgi:hypothetical protein